jgi:hypothetical protein
VSNIDSKLDKIQEVLTDQAVTLGRLTVSVEEHVRRTNILENDIKPIKTHVAMVHGALKLIGLLSLFATIVEAVLWIKH